MGEDPKKIEEYLSKELFFNRSDKDCFGNIVDKFRHYDMDLDRISSMIGGSYNAHFDKDKKFKFHDLNGVYEKMISLGSKVKLNLSDEGKFEVTIQDGKLGLKGNENTQNQELDNSSSMGMN